MALCYINLCYNMSSPEFSDIIEKSVATIRTIDCTTFQTDILCELSKILSMKYFATFHTDFLKGDIFNSWYTGNKDNIYALKKLLVELNEVAKTNKNTDFNIDKREIQLCAVLAFCYHACHQPLKMIKYTGMAYKISASIPNCYMNYDLKNVMAYIHSLAASANEMLNRSKETILEWKKAIKLREDLSKQRPNEQAYTLAVCYAALGNAIFEFEKEHAISKVLIEKAITKLQGSADALVAGLYYRLIEICDDETYMIDECTTSTISEADRTNLLSKKESVRELSERYRMQLENCRGYSEYQEYVDGNRDFKTLLTNY